MKRNSNLFNNVKKTQNPKMIKSKKKMIFFLIISVSQFFFSQASNAKLNGFYIGGMFGTQSMSPMFTEINGVKNVSGYENYIGLSSDKGNFFGGRVGYLHAIPLSSIFSFMVGAEINLYNSATQSVSTYGADMKNLCTIGVLNGCGATVTEAVMQVQMKNKMDILAKFGLGLADKGMIYTSIGVNRSDLSFSSELYNSSGNLTTYPINSKTSNALYLGVGVLGNVSERVQFGVEYFYTKRNYDFFTSQANSAIGIGNGNSKIAMDISNAGVKMFMNVILF